MRSWTPVGQMLMTTAGCAPHIDRQTRTPADEGVTMPSPDGCFVQVWEAPRFEGVADFINGPRGYSNLRDLPGGRVWHERIRSLKSGPVAAATAYADERFQGTSI